MADLTLRIAGICGSIRPGSYTRMALEIALRGAAECGAETQLIDLATYDVIFCDGKEDETNYPSDVFRLRKAVGAAHGILLATPEYHGGYSGILKNAMDLMGFDEFRGKMVGLIGVAGGSLGAVNALNSLRTIGRALHAWVIPAQATVPEAWKFFDDSGNLLDDDLRERLLEVGRQVTRFAGLHNSQQAREFLKVWEESQPNPGAD